MLLTVIRAAVQTKILNGKITTGKFTKVQFELRFFSFCFCPSVVYQSHNFRILYDHYTKAF